MSENTDVEAAVETPAPPPARRSRRRAPAKPVEKATAGLPPSFEFQTRDTPEERELKAIVKALEENPGKDARVKLFRSVDGAAAFAAKLEQVPNLDVAVRGSSVFALYRTHEQEAK